MIAVRLFVASLAGACVAAGIVATLVFLSLLDSPLIR